MAEVRELLGREPRVIAGTKSHDYAADFRSRAEADLMVVNLNMLAGVRAEIVEAA
jgi:hypothetical protein